MMRSLTRAVPLVMAAAIAWTASTLAAGSAGAGALGDWPQDHGGPGLTNVSTSAGGLSAANVGGLRLLSSVPSQPTYLGAVVDGVNYAYAPGPGSNGQSPILLAQSLVDGHILWSKTGCGTSPLGGIGVPTVGPTAIWMGDGQKFTVINRATHQVVACVNTPKPGPTFARTVGPTQYGDAVFMAHGNKILAFAEATGAKRWQITLPVGQVRTAPAVDAGMVFVAADRGRGGWVYALSAADGHILWTYHRSVEVHRVAVGGGRVLLGTAPGALDEATGQLLWSRPDLYVGDNESPSTDGAHAYYVGDEATAHQGLLFSLDAATGKQVWSTWGSVPSYEGEGNIIIAGGLLFISDTVGDGSDAVVNAVTGQLITRIPVPNSDYFASESVLVDGSAYKVVTLYPDGTSVLQKWGL